MQIRASLAGVLAFVGFCVLVAANGQEEVRRSVESRRSGLIRLIGERQDEVDGLGVRIVALRAEVQAVRRRVSDTSAGEASRLRDLELRAGTRAMRGRGAVVTLTNSEREAAGPVERAAQAVHDVDLQLVVNALWAAGAEAVAVNGQRLVATSPIRAAGETITVNFRPLVPPYEIDAIGVDAGEFSDTAVARRFAQFNADFGIGFDVDADDEVNVPAFVGTVQFGRARPEGGLVSTAEG